MSITGTERSCLRLLAEGRKEQVPEALTTSGLYGLTDLVILFEACTRLHSALLWQAGGVEGDIADLKAEVADLEALLSAQVEDPEGGLGIEIDPSRLAPAAALMGAFAEGIAAACLTLASRQTEVEEHQQT